MYLVSMLTTECKAAQLTAMAAAQVSNVCDDWKQNMKELGSLSWKLHVMRNLRLLFCTSSLRDSYSWDSSN